MGNRNPAKGFIKGFLNLYYSNLYIYPEHNIIFSSSRTRHCFSLVPPPALPRSFQPWITLTSTSLRVPLTLLSRLQCKQQLQLESRPSTSIMVQLTILKSIRLQWGCLFFAIELFQLKLTLSLVLHPRHKLNYFKKAKWDAEWIDAARQIVRDEFERSYQRDFSATVTDAVSFILSDGFPLPNNLGNH